MKKSFLSRAALAFILLTIAMPTWAQKIKVRKVKGNQAVVDFSGEPLQNGQVYELTSESFSEPTSGGSRDHVIGLQASFSSGKFDSAGAKSETVISLQGRYGWNHGTYEFGPLVGYSSTNSSGTTISTIRGGAFGDFNLVPNSAGEAFVYGAGGSATFGSNDSGSGVTRTTMSFAAGPFVKLFNLSGSFAIRLDGLYQYDKYSGNGGDATYSGFLLLAGFSNYF
jgi:hypothetical protein